MRVRIRSYNAFAEFLGLPDRRDNQPPAPGYYLTPADAQRLLHDLATRRPILGDAAIALRTAAVAALVADTGRGVPELAGLAVSALHLDGDARVELADGLPARRPGRGDPHPVARGPRGDHRRTGGQRPRLPVDPGQARAAPGRPPAGQARPGPRRRADPARRPPHPRQPAARHPAAPRCPAGSRRTFQLNDGLRGGPLDGRAASRPLPSPAVSSPVAPLRSRGRIRAPRIDATGRLP